MRSEAAHRGRERGHGRRAVRLALALALSLATLGPSAFAAPGQEAGPEAPVDINRAQAAGLRALPGVGPEQAARIVAGRPWRSKTELVERGVLPRGVYLSLKHRLIASQPSAPGLPASRAGRG